MVEATTGSDERNVVHTALFDESGCTQVDTDIW